MTRLEERYRKTLRMLPGWYRDDREEEMVATFLAERTDDLELEYAWPGWRETASVAALSVRARLASDVGSARAIAWGDAVRLIALLGLLASAAGGIGYEVASRLHSATTPVSVDPAVQQLLRPGVPQWIGLGFWLTCIAGFLALLLGHRTAAKLLVVAGAVGLFAVNVTDEVVLGGSWPPVRQLSFLLHLGVPVLCLVLGFHREAAVPRARPWLIAVAALAGAEAVVGFGQLSAGPFLPLNFLTWVYVVGAVGFVVTAQRPPVAWLWALSVYGALISVPALVTVWEVSYMANHGLEDAGLILAVTIAEAAGAVIATTVLAVSTRRALRTLPTEPTLISRSRA